MKLLETTFNDYINPLNIHNLHPKYDKLYKLFSDNLSNMKNIILYGPKGIGKYTQMLQLIKKYSPSELKYEKKFSITFQKKHTYIFKISDIHYEIDMSLLGCNARVLWNDVFNHIIDIINTKHEKSGIIVCKYFHEIHSELLDVFYNYMQNFESTYTIRFVFITEHISFIPENILNTCDIISYRRPTKKSYNTCIFPNKINAKIKTRDITNIKNIKTNITQMMKPTQHICNKIINIMCNIECINYLELREHLYTLLVYQLDISDCLWYIIQTLYYKQKITYEQLFDINIHIYKFFKYYNNNYRPIYHLERIILNISSIVNGL
jgi:hypothetical protein